MIPSAILLCALQGVPSDTGSAPSPQPNQNVLLILADDLGVDSLAMYGRSILPPGTLLPATPNLDALRRVGIKFNRFWVTPACMSTRASIDTGRHPFRTGLGRSQGNGPSMSSCETTIPEMLEELGYRTRGAAVAPYSTSYIGKWHQSNWSTRRCAPVLEHGYDSFYGTLDGVNYLQDDYGNWTRTVMDGLATPPVPCNSSKCTTYLLEQQYQDASQWLRTAGASGPWFQFFAPEAPYKNHHYAPPVLYSVAHYPRLQAIDQGPGLPGGFPRVRLDRELQREAYLACVESLDTQIGRLLTELHAQSGGSEEGWQRDRDWWQRSNLTVIFAGDNGTPVDAAATAPPFFGSRGKETAFEAGVRAPLLIAGAAVPEACRGSETDAYACGVDLFATIGELALGAPVNYEELLPVPIDGVSLVPILEDPWNGSVRDHLYSEYFFANVDTWMDPSCENLPLATGGGAVRLVRKAFGGSEYRLWYRRGALPDATFANGVGVHDELYNVTVDPAETDDLAGPNLSGVDLAAYWELRQIVEDLMR